MATPPSSASPSDDLGLESPPIDPSSTIRPSPHPPGPIHNIAVTSPKLGAQGTRELMEFSNMRLAVGALTEDDCRDCLNTLNDRDKKVAIYSYLASHPKTDLSKKVQQLYSEKVVASCQDVLLFDSIVVMVGETLKCLRDKTDLTPHDMEIARRAYHDFISGSIDNIGGHATVATQLETKRNGMMALLKIGLILVDIPAFTSSQQGRNTLKYDGLGRAFKNITGGLSRDHSAWVLGGKVKDFKNLILRCMGAGIFPSIEQSLPLDGRLIPCLHITNDPLIYNLPVLGGSPVTVVAPQVKRVPPAPQQSMKRETPVPLPLIRTNTKRRKLPSSPLSNGNVYQNTGGSLSDGVAQHNDNGTVQHMGVSHGSGLLESDRAPTYAGWSYGTTQHNGVLYHNSALQPNGLSQHDGATQHSETSRMGDPASSGGVPRNDGVPYGNRVVQGSSPIGVSAQNGGVQSRGHNNTSSNGSDQGEASQAGSVQNGGSRGEGLIHMGTAPAESSQTQASPQAANESCSTPNALAASYDKILGKVEDALFIDHKDKSLAEIQAAAPAIARAIETACHNIADQACHYIVPGENPWVKFRDAVFSLIWIAEACIRTADTCEQIRYFLRGDVMTDAFGRVASKMTREQRAYMLKEQDGNMGYMTIQTKLEVAIKDQHINLAPLGLEKWLDMLKC